MAALCDFIWNIALLSDDNIGAFTGSVGIFFVGLFLFLRYDFCCDFFSENLINNRIFDILEDT